MQSVLERAGELRDYLSALRRELHRRPELALNEYGTARVIERELDKIGVRDILWQSNALVLPTRCDAQGLVLLEAMCSGLPVVTTEAVPQSVRIPGACTIVPIGDAVALADAMSHVMTLTPDPAWVEQAREVVSPQAVARRLESIFMER